MKVGDVVDEKYELSRLIIENGLERVFEGLAAETGRRVIINAILPGVLSGGAVSQCLEDTRLAGDIGEGFAPPLVSIFQGLNDEQCVAHELLEGLSLADVLEREGPMDPRRVLSIGLQLCRGLSLFHRRDVGHYGLCPQKILLRRGSADDLRVMDFGLARLRELARRAGFDGVSQSAAHYRAPEQLGDQNELSHHADIYSTGVILYELLTGCAPYQGETRDDLVILIATTKPKAIRELRPQVPPALEEVVARAIAREPAERYESMASFAEALEKLAPRAATESSKAAESRGPAAFEAGPPRASLTQGPLRVEAGSGPAAAAQSSQAQAEPPRAASAAALSLGSGPALDSSATSLPKLSDLLPLEIAAALAAPDSLAAGSYSPSSLSDVAAPAPIAALPTDARPIQPPPVVRVDLSAPTVDAPAVAPRFEPPPPRVDMNAPTTAMPAVAPRFEPPPPRVDMNAPTTAMPAVANVHERPGELEGALSSRSDDATPEEPRSLDSMPRGLELPPLTDEPPASSRSPEEGGHASDAISEAPASKGRSRGVIVIVAVLILVLIIVVAAVVALLWSDGGADDSSHASELTSPSGGEAVTTPPVAAPTPDTTPAPLAATPTQAPPDSPSPTPESLSKALPNPWILVFLRRAEPLQLGVSSDRLAASIRGFRPSRGIKAPTYPFEIQQHEVTWGELIPWIRTQPDHHVRQPSWVPARDYEQYPATAVPWATADAYCRALGGALPTEEEWELAARGERLRPYPWGASRLDTKRVHAFRPDQPLSIVMTSDQDVTPGPGEQAIYDLMGNAMEWTSDPYRGDVEGGEELLTQADGLTFRAVRGFHPAQAAPSSIPEEGAAHRTPLCAVGACSAATERILQYVGFRCAREAIDVPPERLRPEPTTPPATKRGRREGAGRRAPIGPNPY